MDIINTIPFPVTSPNLTVADLLDMIRSEHEALDIIQHTSEDDSDEPRLSCRNRLMINGTENIAQKPGDPGYIDLLRHLFIYDPLTGILTRRIRYMNASPAGDIVGSLWNGYLRMRVRGRKTTCHRVGWAIYHGEWPEMDLDHINGIRHDNRIINLRLVTHQQNCFNSKISKRNTSGVKGVAWSKASRKWVARIMIGSKDKHLGVYSTLGEAEAAVIAARERLHGEHARHG